MKIKTNEFIKKVAERAGVTQLMARKIYDCMGDVVLEELAKENTVKMFKGLTIYGERRAERVWDCPLTGERLTLPSRVSPRAKFTEEFKSELRDMTAD